MEPTFDMICSDRKKCSIETVPFDFKEKFPTFTYSGYRIVVKFFISDTLSFHTWDIIMTSCLNLSGDESPECPLCMELFELDDINFYPCTCGYQVTFSLRTKWNRILVTWIRTCISNWDLRICACNHNVTVASYFYRTRVRSLAMLVTNWLTDSLTDSLTP